MSNVPPARPSLDPASNSQQAQQWMASVSMVLGLVGVAILPPGFVIVLIYILGGDGGAYAFGYFFLLIPMFATATGHRYLLQTTKGLDKGRRSARAGVTLGWVGIAFTLLATWGLNALALS